MKMLVTILGILLVAIFTATPKPAGTIPKILGASNEGNEFWFSVPPTFTPDFSINLSVKILVTSQVKTNVTVEVRSKGYSVTKQVLPYEITEFTLSFAQALPWNKTQYEHTLPDSIFKASAIHIYSNDAIVVYSTLNFNYAKEGWLCLPVSSCGREYIISTPEVDPDYKKIPAIMPSTVTITSCFDDTRVRFTLGGNAVTKTTGGKRPGETKEYSLMKGDVLVISTESDNGDLSGSKVISTKPISVVSGNSSTNVPVGTGWGNYTAEMEIPDYLWGSYYHIPKIPGRKYSSLIKIVAKEPNTKIYRNGIQFGAIKQSGGIINNGYLYIRMNPDSAARSVVISADKPIAVTLFNCGAQDDYPDSSKNNVPVQMSIIPDEQMMKEITFMAISSSDNNINLVYETNSIGMMPDEYEYAGPIKNGVIQWKRLNAFFPSIDELFKSDVNGKKYAVKKMHLTETGVYKIRTTKPAAAYSYGFSQKESYGFPSAINTIDLEFQDTVPPVPTWTQHCDGNVTDGVVTDMPEDRKVRSNLALIIFNSDSSYNYNFKYVDFIPGETRTTEWRLDVIDPNEDARAVITFTDRRGNDTTIQIDFYAMKLAVRLTPCNFGWFKTGETKTLDFWVVNYSDQSTELVKFLKLMKNNVGFTINLPAPLPWTISKMDSVKFTVTFTAKSNGYCFDSIGVGDDCQFFYRAKVEANVENPIIFVDDVTFDAMLVGNTSTKDFHVTNEGNNPLILTGYTGPSLSIYTTSLPLIDNTNPLSLQPKETQTFQVTYKPTSVGKFRDSIVFISDADTNRKNVCYINGEGRLTDINEFENKSLNILNLYPEPSSGSITIETNLQENISAEIQITDIAGRMIKSFKADLSRETKFEFSSLSDGVYFIKIQIGGETASGKFTIGR